MGRNFPPTFSAIFRPSQGRGVCSQLQLPPHLIFPQHFCSTKSSSIIHSINPIIICQSIIILAFSQIPGLDSPINAPQSIPMKPSLLFILSAPPLRPAVLWPWPTLVPFPSSSIIELNHSFHHKTLRSLWRICLLIPQPAVTRGLPCPPTFQTYPFFSTSRFALPFFWS